MKRQTRAYLYAATTVLLWSTVASAFKLSLRHLTPQELLFYATLVSCCVLLGVVIITRRRAPFASWTKLDMVRSAVLGFLNPFLYYRVLFEAYALLPAQQAQPLNFTWPIVLALLSIAVLRQPITAASLVALLLSFGGVIVIATHGDLFSLRITDSRGVLLALGSTVVWASYWIYAIKDRRDPITRLLANFVWGGFFAGIDLALARPLRIPNVAGLLGAAYVGTFEMGITFVTWITALRLSRTTAQVANLVFLTPFLSLFFIRYAVGEPILESTLVGLMLIVLGNVFQRWSGNRQGRDS